MGFVEAMPVVSGLSKSYPAFRPIQAGAPLVQTFDAQLRFTIAPLNLGGGLIEELSSRGEAPVFIRQVAPSDVEEALVAKAVVQRQKTTPRIARQPAVVYGGVMPAHGRDAIERDPAEPADTKCDVVDIRRIRHDGKLYAPVGDLGSGRAGVDKAIGEYLINYLNEAGWDDLVHGHKRKAPIEPSDGGGVRERVKAAAAELHEAASRELLFVGGALYARSGPPIISVRHRYETVAFFPEEGEPSNRIGVSILSLDGPSDSFSFSLDRWEAANTFLVDQAPAFVGRAAFWRDLRSVEITKMDDDIRIDEPIRNAMAGLRLALMTIKELSWRFDDTAAAAYGGLARIREQLENGDQSAVADAIVGLETLRENRAYVPDIHNTRLRQLTRVVHLAKSAVAASLQLPVLADLRSGPAQ